MRTGFRWRYAGGVALVAAVTFVLFAVFSQLCVTDKADIDLMDRRKERFGWRYELLVDGEAREYAPEFSEGSDSLLALPEGTRAVRVTRTMTEEIPRAELQWSTAAFGVEVALDGALLYTDFYGIERDANGFLRPVEERARRILEEHQRSGSWRKVRMTLPADYLGKELSMTTYFPEGWENPEPEYPVLGSEDSAVAGIIVASSMPMAAMTMCGLLALLVAGVYLLDGSNGRADGKILLLCLYYLLLFLDLAYDSDAGYFGMLTQRVDLRFLHGLYVAPLYLYLALRLRKKWKYPLCVGAAAWALYEGARMFFNVRRGDAVLAGRNGLGAFALFLAVAAATAFEICLRVRRKGVAGKGLAYGLAAVAVTAIYARDTSRSWSGVGKYLAEGVWGSMRGGYFMPAVHLIANVSAAMATIVLVTEFARRTLRTRQEMSALQERTRQTLESYNRLLAAEEATNALRHEMRHHLTALSGLLKDGDVGRAARYVAAISDDLDRIPAGRYSRNPLVNVIAGSYLDRARARGIQVEHRLNVPPELDIADEDLSVLLSNMLQNALEACERLEAGAERYIRVEMRLRGNFLFVKCVNSAPDAAAREERPGHGYGLAAMRRIAEKYDSVLLAERASGEFTVKSDLFLGQGGAV